MGEKKRRLAAGLASAPATASEAGPARAPDLDAQLAEAHHLLANGRPRDAFALAQQALARAPGHAPAMHVLGRCCLAVGQMPTGVGLLQAAAKAQPRSSAIQADLGRALVAAGRLDDAVAPLQAAAAASAEADIDRDLGGVLLRLGRVQEAEAAYARAAELAPQRADLHEALARLRYERDALDLAATSYAAALALEPALADRLAIGHACAGAAIDAAVDPTRPLPQPLPPAWPSVVPAYPDVTLDRVRAACEARALIVLDDFLADPYAYREQALRLEYPLSSAAAGINFPGRQTRAQPCAAIMQRIADAFARDLKWDSPDQGAFRFSPADASARSDIHVDSAVRSGIHAAVLYLSRPEDCRGGTLFWRHRATGWELRPAADELAAAGYASFEQFERRWMPALPPRPFDQLRRQRETDWEVLLQVPMRFNRLVAYRSDFFHSIDELFGDRPENARFVQLFHFEAIVGPGSRS